MLLRKSYLALLVFAAVARHAGAGEVFVGQARPTGTLEMRGEATVFGPEVRLRQVCQWADGDERLFGGVGDLVVTRITSGSASINLVELRAMLRDAGMSMASVRFAGPTTCTVTRADAAAETPAVKPVPPAVPASQPAAVAQDGELVSLKERLTRDLAERLQLPIESLQISFSPTDEKLLNLAEPQFRFQIEPRRVRNLGAVVWEVTATTEAGGAPQKAVISATARAWQDQVVVNRPVSGRQVIRAEDLVEKRSLVDSVSDSPVLTRAQAVGQQAALDLKPGAVVSSRMVQAVPLARVGQLVTVTIQSGGVQVRTVAKAVDEGTYGQTIRVRNEGTKEMYDVTLTGQQTGVLTTGGGQGSNG